MTAAPAAAPRRVGSDAGLDLDLGDALAAGLLGPVPGDLDAFERRFVDVVERSDVDPAAAWDRFYDTTLDRVAAGWGRQAPGVGTTAVFTRIWSRAAALQRGGSALDVGTCFGVLPLAWAAQPGAPRLLALELVASTAAMVGRQARRLGRQVSVLCADGARLPLPDGAVDTVHLLHVLEHLPDGVGREVLAQCLRVARDRVVVAVPVEARPDPLYGHVRTFDLASLAELGRRTGWHSRVLGADGAWLVLDRPHNPTRSTEDLPCRST